MKRRTLFTGLAGAIGAATSAPNPGYAGNCPAPVRGLTYEIYREPNGDWRWRLKSRNGNTIADSAEGYRRKETCLAGIELVKRSYDAALINKEAAE